jgi:hypothetical protein
MEIMPAGPIGEQASIDAIRAWHRGHDKLTAINPEHPNVS